MNNLRIVLWVPFKEWGRIRFDVLLYLIPEIFVFPLERRELLMNVSWIVPSAYVMKVSMCVTRKNRIMKDKLPVEKMLSPCSHGLLAHAH